MISMTTTCSRNRRQLGLSLVELMIALVVGLVLLAGVVQIFVSSKMTYRTDRGVADVQENGRFALDFLRHDIRMAGYTGCGQNATYMKNNLNPTGSNFLYQFDQGITGFDATPGGTTFSPALDPSLTGLTHNPLPGSDVLTLRFIQGTGTTVTVDMPSSSADFKVIVSNPPVLAVGDIILMSDCAASVITQVTNYTLSNGNTVHNTGSLTPGNSTKNLGRAFKVGSEVDKIATVSYFVAPEKAGATSCSNMNCGLWEKIGTGAEQELVAGIENMQVLYGVDLGSDNTADQYVTANNVTNWNNVVSVQLWLLASSAQTAIEKPANAPSYSLAGSNYTPPNDMHLRHVFTATVAIRNRTL